MTAKFVSRRSVLATITVCLTLCLTLTGFAQQPPADAIIGTWAADDGSVKLDLQKAGSEFQARLLYGNEVVEADDVTFKQDVKNPGIVCRIRRVHCLKRRLVEKSSQRGFGCC